MGGVVLASKAFQAAPDLPLDDRTFWLESPDRRRRQDLNADPYRMLVGAVGMESPDVDVVSDETPGVPGGSVAEVSIPAREIALPMRVRDSSALAVRTAKGSLRTLLQPGVLPGEGVSAWLCCSSTAGGVREIGVLYRGGLEGSEPGQVAYDAFGLDLLCPDPWAHDTTDREVVFRASSSGLAMVSANPAAAASAGTVRGLGSTTILGVDMPVTVVSDVPVWPTLEFTGPFTSSMRVQADTGLDVTVPAGLAAGSVLRVVTDPRAKSIRRDGVATGSAVAWGSRLAPLQRGVNRLAVTGAGAGTAASMSVSWRGSWRCLWG